MSFDPLTAAPRHIATCFFDLTHGSTWTEGGRSGTWRLYHRPPLGGGGGSQVGMQRPERSGFDINREGARWWFLPMSTGEGRRKRRDDCGSCRRRAGGGEHRGH